MTRAPHERFFEASLTLMLLATCANADIPVVGRPADVPFSGASAGFVREGDAVVCPFVVTASVSPDRVEVEQPLTFTVEIRALGKVDQPPTHIDPREIPSFDRWFHIEDVTNVEKERAGTTSWRWQYRLKPRNPRIDQVPRLPFVFHNPDLRPTERSFQTIWTLPQPITVTDTPPEPPDIDVSPAITALVPPYAVLGDRTPWAGPSAVLLTAVLAAPPIACAAWYLAWRRLYPDASRRAVLRRSRAAHKATAALKAAARRYGRARAEAVSAAVVGYLRERFELPMAEPTPDEAADWVRERCADPEALRQLLTACAAGRFALDETSGQLVEQARAFVTAAEEVPCTPPS